MCGAPFDEKLSVIGLVLSKLGNLFKEAMEQENYTASLMEQLKLFQDGTNKSATSRLGDVVTALSMDVTERRLRIFKQERRLPHAPGAP